MMLIFCQDELEPRQVDSCFRSEADAATATGFEFGLIDFQAVRKGNGREAVRLIPDRSSSVPAIYRGWMLTPFEYKTLDGALSEKRVRLITTVSEYQHCHWFPESYEIIEPLTPRSTWIPEEDQAITRSRILSALRGFRDVPLIVKDYVKSRKHDWMEACYIPNASDESVAIEVVERFLELQGEDLQGGIVLREFVDLERIAMHPISGMPLSLEYRLFVVDRDVIVSAPYWDECQEGDSPQLSKIQRVIENVQSRFFTCDVAKTAHGQWIILEIGDGQVSGLPSQLSPQEFYRSLRTKFS